MRGGAKRLMEVMVLLAALVGAGCGSGGGSGSEDITSGYVGGGSGGTGITNMVDSPCEMNVGDIMAIEFEETDEVAVDMSCLTTSEKFILAVGSYASSGSGSSIQLAASASAPETKAMSAAEEFGGGAEGGGGAEEDGYGAQEIMSAWLRASEVGLHDEETPSNVRSVNFSKVKAMGLKAVAEGQTETFRVLSTLSSTSSYTEVTGEARCVGNNVVFYVDTHVPESTFSSDNIETLCADFDGAAGSEQSLLGSASDVDGDGKVHVLMTKQINRLGALGGGIITGYFYAGDLYARSSSNPVSNNREIIYTMVPDPDGQYGTAITTAFAMSNLLPAVLPHELQHAISYNQHVLVNGGVPEENWLNEGLSHFMEDWTGYGVENPSRFAMYLASPSTYGVVTQGSPNLMERGAAYLLVRFAYEQASDGDALIRSLVSTQDAGVENFEAAAAAYTDMDSFSQVISRWTAALAMTNRGISSDLRYIYRDRVRNGATGNWQGVCLICDADDNRGTELTGVNLNVYSGYHTVDVDAATAKYFNVTTIPSEMRFTAGSAGDGSFALLVRYQ